VTDQVEAWLDSDFLERMRVGTLNNDRGTLRSAAPCRQAHSSQGFRVAAILRTWSGVCSPASGVPGIKYLPMSAPPTTTGSNPASRTSRKAISIAFLSPAIGRPPGSCALSMWAAGNSYDGVDLVQVLFAMMSIIGLTGTVTAAVQAPPVAAIEDPKGAEIFKGACAACHENVSSRAPSPILLSIMSPNGIVRALTDGVMRGQGQTLSAEDTIHVAQFLTKRKIGDATDRLTPPTCSPSDREFAYEKVPAFSGWGITPGNTHHVANTIAGLTKDNVSKLHLKWAVGFSGAIRIRSQPAMGGGSIFVGTQDGILYSLNLETGCARWQFPADSEIRTGIVLSPWSKGDRSAKPLLYFADESDVYALDPVSGKEVWRRKPDNHPRTLLTAAPVLYKDMLLIGPSSVEELASLEYECCTFRGGVVAYAARSGQELWRSFTVDPPKIQGKNAAGTNKWAPSGAAVWSSPAIDVDRNQLYMGTGDNYSRPSTATSDSIIAMDLKDGKIKWVYQATKDDVWNTGCLWGQRELCPEPVGPDFDFGAAPVLARADSGTDIVVAAQKSGYVYGINPDTGQLIWKTKAGRGGTTGGVEFALASANNSVYVGVVDFDDGKPNPEPLRPGLYSLDLLTGKYNWRRPDSRETCRGRSQCIPGIYAALTVTPQLVIAGNTDGWLRIHDAATGELLWHYDMTEPVVTVGGGAASGGAMGGPTAAVPLDGKLIVPTGYGMAQCAPGDVVLVFDTK
jgi:polyvinyl alcohol dehydrogenase (cytochrome)